jgi:hypothetical protein
MWVMGDSDIPGRNLSPTANDGEDEGCVLSNGPNTEHCSDRDWTRKHQEPKKSADKQDEPYRVDWCLGVRVNFLQPS